MMNNNSRKDRIETIINNHTNPRACHSERSRRISGFECFGENEEED